MRKRIAKAIVLCGLLLSPIPISADTGKYSCIIVETKDGHRDYIDLSDDPTIHVDGPKLTLRNSLGTAEYAPGDVQQYYFSKDWPTKTEELTKEFDIVVRLDGQDKVFVGGKDAETVTVTSLDGITKMSVAAIPAEGFTVDLGNYANGIYIITVNNTKHLKVAKR